MTIDKATRGNAGIVTVDGRMDADASTDFEAACTQLTARGAKHVVADLTALTYISSMGLRAFLAVAKARQEAGGELVLVGLAGFVKQVFDLTRVTSLFRLCDSVEAALEALK